MRVFATRLLTLALPILYVLGEQTSNQDAVPLDASLVLEDDGDEQTYGVIIDCGSSGTRVHIFQWTTSLDYPDLLEHVSPLLGSDGKPAVKHVNPGLSSFRDKLEDVPRYMKPIIDFIADNIPIGGYSSTSIYVMGTAGMRMLPRSERAEIWGAVHKFIKSNYNFGKVDVGIITGPMEGVYQWMSVNSKAHRFLTSPNTDYKDTYSVIEMGGASIQVTFQVSSSNLEYISRNLGHVNPRASRAFYGQLVMPSISELDRNSEPLELASITFPGLGSDKIRDAYVDMLIKEAFLIRKFNANYLADPCLPIGAKEKRIRPVRMLKSAPTVGYTVVGQEETMEVSVKGYGQHSLCRENLIRLLDIVKSERTNCRANEPCSYDLIGEDFIPYKSLHFVGISDIFYTLDEVINMAGIYKRPQVIEKTAKICETPFKRLMRKYNEANQKDEDRVLEECFKATWVEVFLSFAIKLPYRYKELDVVGSIAGQEVDWTLGAILDESLAMGLAENDKVTAGSRMFGDGKTKAHAPEVAVQIKASRGQRTKGLLLDAPE